MAVIIRGKNKRKPYTVRYWVAGRQRERSFMTSREARDYKTLIEYEARTQSFTDPKLSSVRFTDYAYSVINGRAISDGTKRGYLSIMNKWLAPWAGDRTLSQVANDRESAAELLNVTMLPLTFARRDTVSAVLTVIMKEAVSAGRIERHRLSAIKLIRAPGIEERRGFVFPTYDQTAELSGKLASFGPAIWLMRGCGLRISEALAVHRGDFIERGTVLRCQRQATSDGRQAVPLKHRKPGQYRDIPAPGYLWEIIEALPDGPVCPARDRNYFRYETVYKSFIKARDTVGIVKDFTPHSLRHGFASALLANGVPVTDVAVWLGHRDVSVTYQIYAHLIPSASARARSVLDSEFEIWRHAVA